MSISVRRIATNVRGIIIVCTMIIIVRIMYISVRRMNTIPYTEWNQCTRNDHQCMTADSNWAVTAYFFKEAVTGVRLWNVSSPWCLARLTKNECNIYEQWPHNSEGSFKPSGYSLVSVIVHIFWDDRMACHSILTQQKSGCSGDSQETQHFKPRPAAVN